MINSTNHTTIAHAAFLDHLKSMTEEDWNEVVKAGNKFDYRTLDSASLRPCQYAVGHMDDAPMPVLEEIRPKEAAARVHGDAAFAVRGQWSGAAKLAAFEIQGADFMRKHGFPFFWLPLFGFADDNAVILASTVTN